jgi:hypothetical protein
MQYGENIGIGGAVCFRPSRVEGVADVDEVCVSRDALEVVASGERRSFPFLDFAMGREIATGLVPIGELHFSQSAYPESHFVFYTRPRIVTYMPADGPREYPHSHFWRVQVVLRAGGFKMYEGGPPKVPPVVLDPRLGRTVGYVLAVLVAAWVYALGGFLPGPAGGVWREFLLSNPRNPSIGLAFMLPAMVIPVMLGLRHGRRAAGLAAGVVASYVVALGSEWGLRVVVHSWAPLEQPPFNQQLWSVQYLISLASVVTAAELVGWSWRRRYLEPIDA